MGSLDEITSVELPANGILLIGYRAIVKSSIPAAGRVAIFIGVNQLQKIGPTAPEVSETETTATSFTTFYSAIPGLLNAGGGTSFVTTGMPIGATGGGLLPVEAAAGTFSISVRFRATSGTITAKERKLWVGVMGL